MWGRRSDAARWKTVSKSGKEWEISEEDAAARLMNRSSTSVQQICALIKNIYNQVVQYQCVMVRPDWDLLRAATSVRQRCPSCWTAPRQPPKILTSSVWTKKIDHLQLHFSSVQREAARKSSATAGTGTAVWSDCAKGRFLRDGGQTNQK